MVKPEQVSTENITPEQIGRATRVYSFQTRTNFYLVENSRGLVDDEGELIKYAVRYDKQHGFTCECYAGQEGFVHCKLGYCQHVATAIATAKEERAAMIEQEQLQAVKPVDIAAKWNLPAWMLKDQGPRIRGEYSYR